MDQPLPPIRGGICPVRGLEVDPCHDTELNELDTRQNQNFPLQGGAGREERGPSYRRDLKVVSSRQV